MYSRTDSSSSIVIVNSLSASSSSSSSHGSTSITIEMLRYAVEELQKCRSAVTSKMIGLHLRKRYPIVKNSEDLKIELKDKLDYAVSRGILYRCESDTYCLPSFRQQAYNYKTDLSSFWERHYKKRPGRQLRPPVKKKKIITKNNESDDNSSDYFDDSDDE